MSETLETMLEAMPDSYQKTVGFPTYDLLAAAAIPMEELEAQLQETAAKRLAAIREYVEFGSGFKIARAGPALCATRPPAHPASSR